VPIKDPSRQVASTERRKGNFPVSEQSAFRTAIIWFRFFDYTITSTRRAVVSFFALLAAALTRSLCRRTSNALGQHKSNYRLQRAIDTTETLRDRSGYTRSVLDVVTRFWLWRWKKDNHPFEK